MQPGKIAPVTVWTADKYTREHRYFFAVCLRIVPDECAASYTRARSFSARSLSTHALTPFSQSTKPPLATRIGSHPFAFVLCSFKPLIGRPNRPFGHIGTGEFIDS